MASSLRFPAVVQTGARVQVVLPSGPVSRQEAERGIARLSHHLAAEVVLPANFETRTGYLAGDDKLRLACLNAALGDEDPRAIWCARGGYGLTRLLARLDPGPLARNPRLLVGFSDVTALLCWAYVRAQVASLHAPVLTQLGRLDADSTDRLFSWLAGDVPPPLEANAGTTICGGTVEGPLIVGNLEILRSLIGTGYLPDLHGCILAIEEIGERPYRIDRSLTQLLSSGALRGVRGVIVGQLEQCDPTRPVDDPEEPLTALDVVVERLGTLGVPVVTSFGFGHHPNIHAALPFGAQVRLHADDATLEFLEPITQPPTQ